MTPLRYLREGRYRVRFGWLGKKTDGEVNHRKKTITVNLELLVAETFVHEMLHALYPNRREKWVRWMEDELVLKMSPRALRRLAQELLRRQRCLSSATR